jgi:hypothetical protein
MANAKDFIARIGKELEKRDEKGRPRLLMSYLGADGSLSQLRVTDMTIYTLGDFPMIEVVGYDGLQATVTTKNFLFTPYSIGALSFEGTAEEITAVKSEERKNGNGNGNDTEAEAIRKAIAEVEAVAEKDRKRTRKRKPTRERVKAQKGYDRFKAVKEAILEEYSADSFGENEWKDAYEDVGPTIGDLSDKDLTEAVSEFLGLDD